MQGDALVARSTRTCARVRSRPVSCRPYRPGDGAAAAGFAAWREFWNPDRVEALKRALGTAAAAAGFAEDAFAPFYAMAARPLHRRPTPASSSGSRASWGFPAVRRAPPGSRCPPSLPGRVTIRAGSSRLPRVGQGVRPALLLERIGAAAVRHRRLVFPDHLASSFVSSRLHPGRALTLATLLLSIWAMIATLGTLNLMGRPLDIPGLMLSIIVFGLGIDFSIFYVRRFALRHPRPPRFQPDPHGHFSLRGRDPVWVRRHVGRQPLAPAQHGDDRGLPASRTRRSDRS